jgi:hypothetical protein
VTVIAYKDGILAADRQGEMYCAKTERTKIHRIGKLLVGASGEVQISQAIYHWLAGPMDPKDYPSIASSGDATVMVIGPAGRISLYQKGPHPMPLDNKFFALGSGGDAAMATMFLGFSAARAIEVACEVCTGCGGGVDTLTLEPA